MTSSSFLAQGARRIATYVLATLASASVVVGIRMQSGFKPIVHEERWYQENPPGSAGFISEWLDHWLGLALISFILYGAVWIISWWVVPTQFSKLGFIGLLLRAIVLFVCVQALLLIVFGVDIHGEEADATSFHGWIGLAEHFSRRLPETLAAALAWGGAFLFSGSKPKSVATS